MKKIAVVLMMVLMMVSMMVSAAADTISQTTEKEEVLNREIVEAIKVVEEKNIEMLEDEEKSWNENLEILERNKTKVKNLPIKNTDKKKVEKMLGEMIVEIKYLLNELEVIINSNKTLLDNCNRYLETEEENLMFMPREKDDKYLETVEKIKKIHKEMNMVLKR